MVTGPKVIAGIWLIVNFGLLMLTASGPISLAGVLIDKLSAAVLLILSIVVLFTILGLPDQDGFISWPSIGIVCLILSALILTTRPLIFLVLWTAVDMLPFLPRNTQASRPQRFQIRLLLLVDFALIGAAFHFLDSTDYPNFVTMASLDPTTNGTWFAVIVFMAAAIKTAGMLCSFWLGIPLRARKTTIYVSACQGMAAVLPSIYFLSRLQPLFLFSSIPPPILFFLGVATCLVAFPLFDR